MKIGLRTPSIDKKVRARTTGRVKRAAKSAINPFYGKKGMGYLKDPERAIKNKIYHKVTTDPIDLIKEDFEEEIEYSEPFSAKIPRSGHIFSIISILCSLYFITETLLGKTPSFAVYIIGIVAIVIAIIFFRIDKV